jgi:uncharacterized membrane protein YeaQ/YmgE (transglycosylase-associated protein family)
MLSILGWLFIGLFAGSLSQAFMPGKEPGRIDGTSLLGICGALIGGLVGGSPFRARQGDAGFFISLALSVLGALVVLTVYRLALGLRLSTRASLLRPGAFSSKFQTLKRSVGSAIEIGGARPHRARLHDNRKPYDPRLYLPCSRLKEAL